jgi:hypothetical protein
LTVSCGCVSCNEETVVHHFDFLLFISTPQYLWLIINYKENSYYSGVVVFKIIIWDLSLVNEKIVVAMGRQLMVKF